MQQLQAILGVPRKKIKVDENTEFINLVTSEVKRLRSFSHNHIDL